MNGEWQKEKGDSTRKTEDTQSIGWRKMVREGGGDRGGGGDGGRSAVVVDRLGCHRHTGVECKSACGGVCRCVHTCY